MANGKLEARITFTTAQVMTVAITAVGGSPFTVTVAAGSYFPTALLTELQTQLDAASGADGAFTVSGSLGEGGTGIVTIAHATQTITITWTTATDLRDVLGFTGTLTPAALTFSGTNHMRGVWLPTYAINAPRGSNAGHTETNRSELVAPDGTVSAMVYGTGQRRRVTGIEWVIATHARSLVTGEVTAGESFEQFWLDVFSGLYTYFPPSPQVRVYWNAGSTWTGAESVGITIYMTGRTTTELERAGDGTWIGIWRVAIEGYKVPA